MLDELSRNYCALGRCKKIYVGLLIAYLLLFLYNLGGFISIIVLGAAMAVEYYGIYAHKDWAAIAGPAIWLFFGLASGALPLGGAFVGMTILQIIVAAATIPVCIINNRKYRWLEEQPGYPYFNQRFEEQKIDATQHDIKPDYVSRYENMRKTGTAAMQDFGAAETDTTNRSDSGSSGYMDSI